MVVCGSAEAGPEEVRAAVERARAHGASVVVAAGEVIADPPAPPPATLLTVAARFMPYRDACLLHVCSDVPVRPGSGRYHATPGLPVPP